MDFAGNDYPNADNYPFPSFPQALPAPEVEPDDEPLIYIAYNAEWQKVLLAAADQLCQYSSWLGDHDAKILAMNRATYLKWLLQVPVEVGETDWPTPFWDDGTSADDEAPIETQEWYGEVTDSDAPADELTFVENAVIWLLTGFVAIAAAPTIVGGAAAAIFFRTTAVRFTLAWNRSDVREIFRVVIDAVDYGTVDTDGMTEGDIIEMNVDGLAETATHDITIIRTL